VVSDWFGAHDTSRLGQRGLSIEMPGPPASTATPLQAAGGGGRRVDEATIDALVRDVLVLIERTHAVERPADEPEQRRRSRRTGAVPGGGHRRHRPGPQRGPPFPSPASDDQTPSVAVVGPNAADTRIMGGGSSALLSLPHRSILDALATGPELVHEPGCAIDKHTPLPGPDQLVGPDGAPGLEVRFVNGTDTSAEPAHWARASVSDLRWFGSLPPGSTRARRVTLRGAYVPAVSAPTSSAPSSPAGPRSGSAIAVVGAGAEQLPERRGVLRLRLRRAAGAIDLVAGEPIEIDVELRMNAGPSPGAHRCAGAGRRRRDRTGRRGRRVADAAVVVVGTNDDWETEGSDRTTIALPGDQDELVRRVAEVNDRTIVVVNAGAPVAMPWIDDVAAVVMPFFGGMEDGRRGGRRAPRRRRPRRPAADHLPSSAWRMRPHGPTTSRSTGSSLRRGLRHRLPGPRPLRRRAAVLVRPRPVLRRGRVG
jgi:beta-glucosidase